MTQPRRRQLWAAIACCGLLAAAVVLAFPLALDRFARTAVYPVDANVDPAGQAVIVAGSSPSAASYTLLRASLASAGLPSVYLPAGSADSLDDIVVQTAAATGCERQSIWLLGFGDQAAKLLQAAPALGIRGLALIAPENGSVTGPLAHDLILLTGPDANRYWPRFFEQLTGEDATVFTGIESPLSGGVMVQSADGRVSLVQFAGLAAELGRFSPPLLAELAAQIRDRQPAGDAAAGLAAAAGRTASAGLLRAVAACVLLLLAPLAAALIAPGKPSDERQVFAAWPGELAMGLTALLLSASGAWLAEHFGAGRISWPAVFRFLFTGWQGWLHLSWRALVARRADSVQIRSAWPEWLPGAVCLLVPVMLGLVLAHVPGLALHGWRLLLFAALILFNLPLGRDNASWHPVRSAIALTATVAAAAAGGWIWLAAGLLILVAVYWGRRTGRALQTQKVLAALVSSASVTVLSWALLIP